jgi:hypothetical protein
VIQPFAFALADLLMGAGPGEQPYRAVVFVLGRVGHQRAGSPRPRELHERSRKFAGLVNADLRSLYSLDYDPVDIVEFNSFDELLSRKPRGGAVWHDILIVTHGGGEAPAGFTGQIFFGKEIFTVDGSGGDLLAAMNAKRARVEAFRKGFYERANITLAACSGAPAGSAVALYVRDLFGTRGLIKFAVKNVDFTRKGGLGTLSDPENPRSPLRELTSAEWRVEPPKDDLLETLPPAPDSMKAEEFWED